MKTTPSAIEPLESRVAPAAVFTFTDVDGDLVTVKTSKGTNAQLGAILKFVIDGGAPGAQRLTEIDFSASPLDATAKPVFAGTDLTITAVPQDLTPGDADKTKFGDGLVNIGRIDATSSDGDGIDLDLGAIKIAGDLGQITAGTGSALVPAVKSLSVHTIGAGGLSTGALTEMSDLSGAVGSISVKGDWHNVRMTTLTGGPVASVRIGGSLLQGVLSVASDLGSVKVTGDILDGLFFSNGATKSVSIGGSVQGSGGLNALGAMGQVKIGGDLNDGISSGSTIGSISIGGSYALSNPDIAQISIHAAGRIGSIHIGGDFNGVPAVSFISGSSARITAGDIGSVTIDGSIIGGSDDSSASMTSTGGIGTIKVGGDIKGGAGQKSGSIFANQAIKSITVGGSLIGGNDTNTSNGIQEGFESGAILIFGPLGTVKFGGSIIGGNAPFAGSVESDGITSITVGGSIIGGPDTGEFAPSITGFIGSSGAIGTAKVGHDIVGSNRFASGGPNDTGEIGGTAPRKRHRGRLDHRRQWRAARALRRHPGHLRYRHTHGQGQPHRQHGQSRGHPRQRPGRRPGQQRHRHQETDGRRTRRARLDFRWRGR